VARELRRLLLSPERLAAAPATGAVLLEPAEQHYLSRVLRLRPGDRFAVVDGAGHLWLASLAGDQAQLLQPLAGPWQHEPEPQTRLNLAVALPRRDADVLLRMATELGIDGLQPLQAERSVAERWNRPRALAIVDEETRRFMGDMHHRTTAPVIEQLRAGWNETGEAELDRLFRRLPELADNERAEIRQAFERYAAKLLHPPLASLRNESRAGPPHGLLDALRRLFDLKE
jgi:hypothetical protein